MDLNKIYQHNVLDPWPFPDRSVNCIVTSPPYWNLRNYNVEGQLGLEKTPAEFIDKMVQVFREAWRVLRDDGTLWINIGDCYASKGKKRTRGQATAKSTLQGGLDGQCASLSQQSKIVEGIKAKDLVGIPWMLAFALRADGWFLRQDIIWNKPNCMPESTTDRCTRSHEYIFMFSKNSRYYYDHEAIKTPAAESSISRWQQDIASQAGSDRQPGNMNGTMKAVGGPRNSEKQRGHVRRHNGFNDRWDHMTVEQQQSMGANKRSVWTVATAGFKEAHFATFPEELIIDPILAGCPARYFECDNCNRAMYLSGNNKSEDDTYLQKMRGRVQSGGASPKPSQTVLFETVQLNMDCPAQDLYQGMVHNEYGIQANNGTGSSECFEVRLCDGTPPCNGEAFGQVPIEDGGGPPQGPQQTEQPYNQSASVIEAGPRSTSEAPCKGDNLPSLWEENKSIGTCPKCRKGHMIGKKGVILDCFMGAGTTGLVALKQGRNFLGLDINPKYIKMAERRLQGVQIGSGL